MLSLATRLTQADLLRLFALSLFIGWWAIYLAHHVVADRLVSDDNVLVGRDFMAFYAAGRLIHDGRGRELYDLKNQQQIQDVILAPETLTGSYYYINPAGWAVLFAPLARLPYLTAFHVHTLVMLAFLILGVWLVRNEFAVLGAHWPVAAMLGFLWSPMSQTVSGGQNAAFVFFLLALAFVTLKHGQPVLCGASLGVLLFKPQYALPILGLLFLRGQWKVLMTASLLGIGWYLLGAWQCGMDWPVKMSYAIKHVYRPEERLASGATHISIMELLDHHVIKRLEVSAGADLIPWVRAAGWLIIGGIIAGLMWLWRRKNADKYDLGVLYGLTVAATLLISLHTQYYETALLVLPVIILLSEQQRQLGTVPPLTRLLLALTFIVAGPLCLISKVGGWLPFQPLALLPLAVAGWAVYQIHSIGQSSSVVHVQEV